jgi:hypothetical protein
MSDERQPPAPGEWIRLLRPRNNPGATIYGTIVAAAIVATEGAANTSIARIVGTVLATLLVYWLAHAYSDLLAGHATDTDTDTYGPRRPGHPTWHGVGESLTDEWGIVAGGLGLVIVMVVVDLAGGDEQLAVNVALLCSVVELVVWGVLAARRAELRFGWVVLYAMVSAALGVMLGLLKVALH